MEDVESGRKNLGTVELMTFNSAERTKEFVEVAVVGLGEAD
jgi:hypothetical protein